MTDPGYVKLLSMPAAAFIISACIVAAFSFIFFRNGRDRRGDTAVRYWKLLSLVAEICLAVGLIGLAAYAGRMKIGAEHQQLSALVAKAQADLGDRFRTGIETNCEPGIRRTLTAFTPGVAQSELCAISSENIGVVSPETNWVRVEIALRQFPAKYPGCIENVFTRNSDCEHTVKLAIQMADDIKQMQAYKAAMYEDASMAEIILKQDSAGFLLLAFLFAAIGVSIKCARAASEFLGPRKSAGNHIRKAR